MIGEKAVQRRIRHHEVAPDPDREVRPDDGNRVKEVHDHLRAPVRHLAPGEQVAEEGLGHQAQENQHAEDPQKLARLSVRTVEHRAEHVQVDADEEERGAGRVHVANPPAPGHLAHDVLDRGERLARVGLVIHGEEDAGDDLDHQHEERERAEVIPEIEILRRVILGEMRAPVLHQREALIDPGEQAVEGSRPGNRLLFCCSHSFYAPFLSSPIRILLSERYI